MISVNIPVEDCTQYTFEVEFFSARKEIGEIQNLNLPPLADIPGYVPPPVTSVIAISFSTAGKPIYGVKTTSGVNAACLPAYFEAYDAYTLLRPLIFLRVSAFYNYRSCRDRN